MNCQKKRKKFVNALRSQPSRWPFSKKILNAQAARIAVFPGTAGTMTKRCQVNKLLQFCLLRLSPGTTHTEGLRQAGMDLQRMTLVVTKPRRNFKCAVCREDARGQRRAACETLRLAGRDPNSLCENRECHLDQQNSGRETLLRSNLKQLLWKEQKRRAWESEQIWCWNPTLVTLQLGELRQAHHSLSFNCHLL